MAAPAGSDGGRRRLTRPARPQALSDGQCALLSASPSVARVQRTPFIQVPANVKGMGIHASEALWGTAAGKVGEGCSGAGSKAR
eukprot:5140779-Prymnesium_polylepis.5